MDWQRGPWNDRAIRSSSTLEVSKEDIFGA
jgi:hypothetical protein